MVFLGKPSSDCLPCRKRKLRCDLHRSGCGQCRRAKLLCHGFRNPDDLIVRDETIQTKQKALARQAGLSSSSPQTLQLSWDVRARGAFFEDYVFQFSRSCDVLAPLLEQAPATGHLAASVDAVSVALMSFRTNAPLLRQLAKEKYVAALQKLGQALRFHEVSATDETLQSVLLLDLWEKLVNKDPVSSVAWMSHVVGAISLVKSCGDRFVATQTGRRLATRLAMTLAISCGAARLRIPDALLSLREDLSSCVGDTKWDFTAIVVDVVNLQADIASLPIPISSSAEIAGRANELDAQIEGLETALSTFWAPRSVSMSAHPLLFGSSYDIYQDHFVTQVRNAFRTVRLMLNSIIQKYCPPELSITRNDATEAIKLLSEQICAAVTPFILSEDRQGSEARFSSLQTLQCYTLIPPLYIAGQLSSSRALREWAIHIMNHMAEAGRMKIAKDVANILKFTPEVDYWQIYSMVGCYALAA